MTSLRVSWCYFSLCFDYITFCITCEAKPQIQLCTGISFSLCDQDPLCIVEQNNFDHLCSLLRCFTLIDGPKRRQLVDSLCSSLTCLSAWIDRLLDASPEALDRDAVILHRSAFKAYIFFLYWLSQLAAGESRAVDAQQTASQLSSASTKGKSRKKQDVQEVAGWQWSTQFPKLVKTVAQALNTDIRAMFRPNRPEEGLMMATVQLVGSKKSV